MPEVMFTGPAGRLHGRYQHHRQPGAPVALILHNHTQVGGHMNQRIAYELYQCFARRGCSVLRFNFRGAGKSQGVFDNGPGELADAAAALDWMQSFNPNASACWVAGYQFGAWVGMQLLMRRPEISGFISITPPANMFDFTFLAPCPSSGLIVHGRADQVVPEADVQKMHDRLAQQKGIKVDFEKIEGANHFYDHKLEELIGSVESYLDVRMAPLAESG